MTSHYRNTSSLVYLLFCLFIISASANSIIRQFTDDFNTNLQQDGGDLEKAHKHQEIASRDYKLSLSSTVTVMREGPPSTYTLKMDSYSTLRNSNYVAGYESRPFSAGGYNWTLIMYPKGSWNDGGSGYISLFVAIDNSTLLTAQQEVHANLRFYIFNKNQNMYFTIEDTYKSRFSVNKTRWGFAQALLVDTFKDPKNGYLYDGDHCEFGVDVTVHSSFEKSEHFTITEKFDDPKFTYKLLGFSTLDKYSYFSDIFSIGGRNWTILLNRQIRTKTEENTLSMYFCLEGIEELRTYEMIYYRVQLRVLNQRNLNNIERKLEYFSVRRAHTCRGVTNFVSFADLTSKGFIVNDALMVQVEMEALSSTTYLPD